MKIDPHSMKLDPYLKYIDIGDKVRYFIHPNKYEDGTVTSKNERFAFVRFAGSPNSKACDTDHLMILSKGDKNVR